MDNKPTYSEYMHTENNENRTSSPPLPHYSIDVYNPLNRLISREEVQEILFRYGINTPIKNFYLYRRAFIHRSYVKYPETEMDKKQYSSTFPTNGVVANHPSGTDIPLSTKSNERLEFVGDGVLECITKYYLYKRFPKEQEGFMTEKKIALVKNESIGKIAMEIGLHQWFILSKHAEEKHIRTNLKKLGCLFEAFVGALFLDFNKIQVNDEDGWFANVFTTGAGFQMAQVFIENVFEKHVDWVELIRNDDNYKNILQVKIQKEFKTTPEYLEVSAYNTDSGYHMGVFLCMGQHIQMIDTRELLHIHQFQSFREIHNHMSAYGKVIILLGQSVHKIKKKAEQSACETAVCNLQKFY